MKTEKVIVTYKAKCPFCGYLCEIEDGYMMICIHYENHDAYEATFKVGEKDVKTD